MSLLLLFSGPPLGISCTGIDSAETFGAATLDVQTAAAYYGFWGKHPRISAQRLQDAPIHASGIETAEAFGVPVIAAGLQAHSITTATATGAPVIRRGVILQDEDFFLLAA